MSTLELEHIKHSSSSSNNLSVNSDGSIAPVTMKGSTATLNIDSTSGNANALFKLNGITTASIEVGGGNSLYLTANNAAGNIYLRNGSSAQTNMTINTSGVIDMPNQPSALFQGNDGSWATINAGNVLNRAFTSSGNGAHAHSSITYNQSNGRFTMAKAGKYFVSFTFYCDAAANNDMRIILRQNGGGIAFNHYDFPSTQSTIGNSSTACLNIAANDYIEFYTPYQVSNYHGPQHTFVSIFKVS